MKKLLFIINPMAGRREAQTELYRMVKVMTDGGYEVTVYPTSRRMDCARKVEEDASRFDLVVCCGGDGTLNEMVNGMMRHTDRVPMGYIPLGSTNDLANSLGLPPKVEDAARRAISGAPFQMDVGSLGGRYFNYIAAFGAFTEASYATPQQIKNVLGHFAYILEGIKCISKIQPVHVKVTADGNLYESDYIFGAVSNTTSLGGIFRLDPSTVRLDDGKYEILLVRNPGNALESQAMLTSLLNRDFSGPHLQMLKASEIRFESDEPISWTIDGEFGGASSDTLIVNNRKAITLMV